ncbi:MAG: crotonase/enoyl-CoA hydratase family protein [Pseudomonadota bacterium]
MSVEVTQHGRVTLVTINRPDVRNAVDGPTANRLAEVFTEFDNDANADVAVLTGADGVFCAGADLKAVSQGGGNKVSSKGNGPLGCSRMLLSKPVIAAVEGFAVAGGLELAMWCDLRVAAEDAVFGVYCRRWGVPLVDGGTIRLSRMLGHSHALDMILTGRPVSGEEARMMGLANRIVAKGEALETALQLAEQLCAFPQLCMRNDRMSSYQQWSMDLPEALVQETKLGLEVIHSGETRAGATRFAEGKGRHGNFDNI